jgi:hypothetical protein
VSDGVTRLRNGNGSSVVLIAVPLVGVMKTICVGSGVAWAQEVRRRIKVNVLRKTALVCLLIVIIFNQILKSIIHRDQRGLKYRIGL